MCYDRRVARTAPRAGNLRRSHPPWSVFRNGETFARGGMPDSRFSQAGSKPLQDAHPADELTSCVRLQIPESVEEEPSGTFRHSFALLPQIQVFGASRMRLARQPGARPRLRWLDPELGEASNPASRHGNVSPLRIRTKVGRTGVDFPRAGDHPRHSAVIGARELNQGQGVQKFPHAR